MRCLIVLLACPFLAGFAPVPLLRPIDDPDQAVVEFDRLLDGAGRYPQESLTRRRQQLIGQLEDLSERLRVRGKPEEAGAVRDQMALVACLDSGNRLGEEKPLALVRQASVGGKYRYLLHVVNAPGDQGAYSWHKDFGFWTGTNYAGQENLKPGHWVYLYPRWYIWRDGPKKP